MQFIESEYQDLKAFLVEKYAKQYSINDPAHQIDHVVGVCDLALEINEKLQLGLDRRMIVIPAITHDLFTHSRSNHHHLACEHLKTVNEGWILGFSMYDRKLMAFAVLQHRASYKGNYCSPLSELIATADRGRPSDIAECVKRAYRYALNATSGDTALATEQTFKHVKNKFGKSGYAKYPGLYQTYFGDALTEFRSEIDNLTLDRVSELVVS